jgi:hypothetical protein
MLRDLLGCLCLSVKWARTRVRPDRTTTDVRPLVSGSTQIARKFESVLGQIGRWECPLLKWVAPLGAVLTHPDPSGVRFWVWVSRLEMPSASQPQVVCSQ